MNLANLTEGQQRVTSSAYYKQQKKLKVQHAQILNTLRAQKIDEKLIGIIAQFLKLESEREGLCVRMTQYLELLTFELYQFVEEEYKDPAPKLFRLFVRLNFNKESIYGYYRDRLDQLLTEKDVDTQQILNRFFDKCSCPVRDDVSYNQRGNALKDDILCEVQNRRLRILQGNENYKPVTFNTPSGIIGALFYAAIESSLIKRPIGAPFYKTLVRFLRGPHGAYEKSTYKNTITEPKETHIIKAREFLIKMIQVLDQRLEDLKK